ncbi:hypothetical protein, partial [Acidiphilium sp.]|uniref:hypothetical protein n=1 Tax=Acidiphilium sp. TaxID=527 RepID=UPI0025835FDE
CARRRNSPQQRALPGVEIQTAPGYSLSASGTSSASPQGFVAEELSPIQSPDAPTFCEISGLT